MGSKLLYVGIGVALAYALAVAYVYWKNRTQGTRFNLPGIVPGERPFVPGIVPLAPAVDWRAAANRSPGYLVTIQ